MISKITPLLMILVIASILGYMTENIWVGLRFGYWDNRGMMMPGLLGYGMAIVGLYLILGLPQKPMLFGHEFFFENSLQGIVFYYVAAGVLVSVAEIVLGNFVEKHCEIVWWNYTGLPLHIGKYTSVPTSMGFAAMITLFMGCVFPRLYAWVVQIENLSLSILTFALTGLLIMDFGYAARYMIRNKRVNRLWQIEWKGGFAVHKLQEEENWENVSNDQKYQF